jgi:drug/metabolite transporter (DMT)-like permease
MRLRDMGLAALTSVIWGFAFVTYKFGLESFSAPQLTAFRFLIACLRSSSCRDRNCRGPPSC